MRKDEKLAIQAQLFVHPEAWSLAAPDQVGTHDTWEGTLGNNLAMGLNKSAVTNKTFLHPKAMAR